MVIISKHAYLVIWGCKHAIANSCYPLHMWPPFRLHRVLCFCCIFLHVCVATALKVKIDVLLTVSVGVGGWDAPLTEAVHLAQRPVLVAADPTPLVVMVTSLLPTNQDWLLPPSSRKLVTGVLKNTYCRKWRKDEYLNSYNLSIVLKDTDWTARICQFTSPYI